MIDPGRRSRSTESKTWKATCDSVLSWSDPLMAVAVLNRNEPAFYCVPAKAYEELMDLVEDLELGRIADARLVDGQEPLRVSLDAL